MQEQDTDVEHRRPSPQPRVLPRDWDIFISLFQSLKITWYDIFIFETEFRLSSLILALITVHIILVGRETKFSGGGEGEGEGGGWYAKLISTYTLSTYWHHDDLNNFNIWNTYF